MGESKHKSKRTTMSIEDFVKSSKEYTGSLERRCNILSVVSDQSRQASRKMRLKHAAEIARLSHRHRCQLFFWRMIAVFSLAYLVGFTLVRCL